MSCSVKNERVEMRQFTQKILATLLLSSLVAPVWADDGFYDDAPVVSVVPQIERVNTPRQECRTEVVRESVGVNSSSPAGSIIGGIAGGLLGSTIGQGNGKVAAAAVGAGVGAIVGDRVGGTPSTVVTERPIERCVTVDQWQEVSRGYLVTYRYNGRDFNTITNTPPGSTVKVRVAVSDANRILPAQVTTIVSPSTYYSASPQVIYREPVRVYQAVPSIMIYGGYHSSPRRDFGRPWGHEREDAHRRGW